MRKVLTAGLVATATVFASTWALAQSTGPGGFAPPFMQGEGSAGMPGMPGHMHMGMQGRKGPGMMGMGMRGHMGPGMMGMRHDDATMEQMRVIHTLFSNHERIKRSVTNLPDGIRTLTESDDPQVAELLKQHVGSMHRRVDAGDDPGL